MTFLTYFISFAIGGVFGYLLGYYVRTTRFVYELERVLEEVRKQDKKLRELIDKNNQR